MARPVLLALTLATAAPAAVRAQECPLVVAHPAEPPAVPEGTPSPAPPRIRSIHFVGQSAVEASRLRARRQGYATWSALVTLAPREGPGGQRLVDVTARVEEGSPWFVGRIGFKGARTTRDPTLRRVVLLDEGDLLDTSAVAESVQRLEALGYVRVRDVLVVTRPSGEPSADITFVMEERPAMRYGLSGGLNALEGVSLAAEVGEVNAFGRGERLFASFQLGNDVRAYEVSVAVPHVFGSPWTAGARARAHRLDLEGVPEGGLPPHTRDEDGFGLFAQRAVGRRARLGFDYSLADVTLTARTEPPPAGFGRRRDGRLAVAMRHDGWDHGWKPRRGLRLEGRARAWGGPLGGSVDALEVGARAFGLPSIPCASLSTRGRPSGSPWGRCPERL